MKINFENNKIIRVGNIWKIINKYSSEKEYLIITPATKLLDLFSFKKDSPLFIKVSELASGELGELINIEKITKMISHINLCFDDLLQLNEDKLKLLKVLLEVNSNILVNDDNLEQVINFISANIKKFMNILIIGFSNLKIVENEYENLNIYAIVEDIIGLITWNNMGLLVLEDKNDYLEIEDKDKLLSWLETKIGTILSVRDIDTYLKGEINSNTLCISKAFRKLV